jgi:hypothetical protein
MKIIEIWYIFKVDGSQLKLLVSVGIRMREEYLPKRRMRTGMRNILEGGVRTDKVSSAQYLHLVDIPMMDRLWSIVDYYNFFFLRTSQNEIYINQTK